MLDSIRKRSNSLVTVFLVLLVAAVMALWGIERLDRSSDGGEVAAWVNGEAITRREFAVEFENKLAQYQAMLGGQYDEKLITSLQIPQRTLEEMIQFRLLSQQAKKLNILVSDSELGEHIRALPHFQKSGKFNPEMYKKLPNRGLEERRQRERLRLIRFQSYLADRIRLTPEETNRISILRETKVDLDYAKILLPALGKHISPTPYQIDSFLKEKPVTDLEQYYESHKGDYTEKAKVHFKQIRVGIPFQASDAKKAEAKAKAEFIHKQITLANFSDTAKKQSDDEYSQKGGEVGWMERTALEERINKVIDLLEPNQISPPIETPAGYFILLVKEKKEAIVKPLQDVKRSVATQMLTGELQKKYAETKRAEWEKKLAQGQSIEMELKKEKMEVKKTGPFSLGGSYIPGIGQADVLLDTAFDLTLENPVSKKLIPYQDGLYYLKLRTIQKSPQSALTKAKDTTEKELSTPLQSELIRTWVQSLQKNATVKTEFVF